MNIQQLHYIIAVEQEGSFVKAAEKSFVTQPTLSMMVHQLEEEWGVKLFDRSAQPIQPTKEGKELITRAKGIVADIKRLQHYTQELKKDISGHLHIGIIPTLAPYLLPLFLQSFAKSHPALTIHVKEMVTNDIISQLKNGHLDVGLLATPLLDNTLNEEVLFYEEFLMYSASKDKLPSKLHLIQKQLKDQQVWLLEEGHCFRNQTIQLCSLDKHETPLHNVYYEAGSIETLINLVDKQGGVTIVPQLACLGLKKQQAQKLKPFPDPKPTREISIVTHQHYPRQLIVNALKGAIMANLPVASILKKKLVLGVK